MIAENLHREYPNKIAHHLEGPQDVRSPRQLTPIFYGCYDWHSAVHSHWAALELGMELSFPEEGLAGELAYLQARPHFEMPYGIAWLLTLCCKAELGPLERHARERFASWLDNLHFPIRTGEHSQSAFAMGLAFDYAQSRRQPELQRRIESKARAFYLKDRNAPVDYEPSAYDFLSPTLAEADLMRRVLPGTEFREWLQAFYPEGLPYRPVKPVSRSDGKLVHFDGLNLSRAWMLHPLDPKLAHEHGAAGMTWLENATYMGTHWLPTFSVYWLKKLDPLSMDGSAGGGAG